jgi:glucoamylase
MTRFVLIAALAALASAQCDITSGRSDCGKMGTTQKSCETSGCCWKPVNPNPNNEPWCFHKSGPGPAPGPSPSGGGCPLNYTSSKGQPFAKSEVATMRKYFMANINIQGSGGVVASPDHNTPGGSYYFHWERDGALSMEALLKTSTFADVKNNMQLYATWVAGRQKEKDPHGQSVLTEPKYMLPDGSVFTGDWCRPQNDGPGLRAKTLMGFANAMRAAADNTTTTTTETELYITSDLWPTIQTDLDWVAANWESNGCDLWEEIRSTDFFWNRFTMRAAMVMGASFAKAQGDSSRSSTYGNAGSKIAATLENHYQDGFVYEEASRKMDAATICAFNDGYLGDGVFSPTSKEVAGTISTLNNLFCGSYTVNQADSKAGVPGVMFGRYAGDHYAGGNPWILLTAALGELLYRGAGEIQEALVAQQQLTATEQQENLLTDLDYDVWAETLNIERVSNGVGLSAQELAAAMAGAGDGVMTRLRNHVKNAPDGPFHLAEQIDRETGIPMSAKDLTWSYATVLKAVHARSLYAKLL